MKRVLVFGAICFFLLFYFGAIEMWCAEVNIEITFASEKDVKLYGVPWIIIKPGNSIGANFEDKIVWQSKRPFAIHFGSNSPVNGMIFWSSPCEDNCHKVETMVVHKPAMSGGIQAKYYVACAVGDMVDIIDPDIVIPPRRR